MKYIEAASPPLEKFLFSIEKIVANIYNTNTLQTHFFENYLDTTGKVNCTAAQGSVSESRFNKPGV